MGEVYCATDTSLGRVVAIKLLDVRDAADDNVRARFTREAHAAARVSGESGIVTIFDVGEWNERPFIVMEYLRGGSLQDLLSREGAQPPARVLAWLEQAAHALDYAHERGVVHRDVKPANLLLDREGRVHVADFGVASAVGLETLTLTGSIIGTAGYLSPEQAEGREATAASDLYALGVVAFELLTSERPFASRSPTAEAAAHVSAPVPAISQRGRGLPRSLDPVFARALAKDPARRYATAADFVAALRHGFAQGAGPTRVVAPPPARAAARRRSPLVLPLLLGALLVAGVLAAYFATRGGGRVGAPITVTQHGTTIHETVTAQAPTTAPPAETTGAATTQTTTQTSGASAAQQGFAKLQAGDPAGAVPLLEQAAQQLQGTGGLSEAYNDYNLALALVETQGCSDQVLQLLDASQAIQGHRPQIDQLRHQCSGPPRPGPGPGPGKEHGKGPKDKGGG